MTESLSCGRTELNDQSSAMSRQAVSFSELLQYLKATDASFSVIQMAIERQGVRREVARLLAQCIFEPRIRVTRSKTTPKLMEAQARSILDCGASAQRFLKKVLSWLIVWFLICGTALYLGVSIGFGIGVAEGVERGFDRLAAFGTQENDPINKMSSLR